MADQDETASSKLGDHMRSVQEAHDRSYGHLQHAGAMTAWQLRELEYFLTRHFGPDAALQTLETGCGSSTLLFSKHANRHTVFCRNDSLSSQTVVSAVEQTPGFNASTVEFVFGPTYETMLASGQAPAVDIALIGGDRSHPIPEIEYFAVRRRLKAGSFLILRDIHIPTIQSLYRILAENDDLHLYKVQENTAFFWCASPPPIGAGTQPWWAQRYNAQNFPAYDALAYTIGHAVPFRVAFDGWLRKLPSYFTRGAMLTHGRPVSGGPLSVISFDLDRPVSGAHEIEIEADCVPHTDGRRVWLTCQINGTDQGTQEIVGSGPQRLTFTGDLADTKTLEIKLHHSGVPALTDVPWPERALQTHQSVLAFRSITVRPAPSSSARVTPHLQGTDIIQTDGAVVSFDFRGTPLSFFVHDRHDSIQAHHAAGQFYEVEELDLLAQHIKPGARILDIGANIGNHTVWFEKIARASSIMPIEPQPRLIKLLTLNCTLNGLRTVDLSRLGCALGRTTARGTIHIPQAFNPAGAIIEHDPAGSVPISPGDEVVGDAMFDFVKIDVEGAELDVVEGLRHMIARCQPLMFVEVGNDNATAFTALMADIGYEIVAEYRRYDIATNLLIRHKGGVPFA